MFKIKQFYLKYFVSLSIVHYQQTENFGLIANYTIDSLEVYAI